MLTRVRILCTFVGKFTNIKIFIMKHNYTMRAILLTAFTLFAAVSFAQSVKFYGVRNTMRYDDGDDAKSTYLGWNSETGKAEFSGDYGLWSLDATANSVEANLVHYDNVMYGNSGSFYYKGLIYTIFSHEKEDSEEWEFIVRKWDAKTYKKLDQKTYPKSSNIESRGMCYNPVDGKIYGLFYLTDFPIILPGDEEYEPSDDDIEMGQTTDAGYALCTIDLETMEIFQITPGIYYDNFVTLSCSPDGRIFAMSSSGVLNEFDAKTGMILTDVTINDEGDPEESEKYGPSGVVSQFKRQCACFDYNTGKLYWNGYVNSGKGYNDWGSYGPLSDKEWRTNGKYDTALYEVNIETGKATKIANIPNRIAFSCLWVDGGDASDLAPEPTGVTHVETAKISSRIYDLSGRHHARFVKGINIVNGRKVVK